MPFKKKILPKLHKFLFPTQEEYARILSVRLSALEKSIDDIHKERDFVIETHKKDLEKLNKLPRPTMADLMRESLGVLPLDFTHVIEKMNADEEARMDPEDIQKRNQELGLPKDFLDTVDVQKREMYIAQLYQIWQLEVFPLMVDHYLNLQGNWTVKKALDDMQVFAGRMTINGIYLIKNKVKSGHDEYKERSKPPDEFDEHELDEGFDISNITNKK